MAFVPRQLFIFCLLSSASLHTVSNKMALLRSSHTQLLSPAPNAQSPYNSCAPLLVNFARGCSALHGCHAICLFRCATRHISRQPQFAFRCPPGLHAFAASARTLTVALQLAHARVIVSLASFVNYVDFNSQLYPFAVLRHLQSFAQCL